MTPLNRWDIQILTNRITSCGSIDSHAINGKLVLVM
eukprot:UN10260